jgi:hypothetical protein
MKSLPVNAHRETSEFWGWFKKHSSELAAHDIPEALIEELETRLHEIHELDWEIGPGRNAPNFFALSPRGDKDLLKLTRAVITKAPDLPAWEFFPAKPPRNWNLVFSLTVDDASIEIDGKLWEFIAYKFKDGTYDLVFKPDSTKGLSEDYLYWAAMIIADGELGEEIRMELVQTLEVVTAWDAKMTPSARKLQPGGLAKLLGR